MAKALFAKGDQEKGCERCLGLMRVLPRVRQGFVRTLSSCLPGNFRGQQVLPEMDLRVDRSWKSSFVSLHGMIKGAVRAAATQEEGADRNMTVCPHHLIHGIWQQVASGSSPKSKWP